VKRALKWSLLLVTVASATAVWHFTRPEPVTVSLYRVTLGPVASTVANTRVGTVKACRRSNVAPATGGQVARLNVAEGSRVKKDQILLEIWNDDLRAQLALAEAELIAAKARAKEACLLAEGAEREARRQAGLQRRRLVAEETADTAETNARSKRAACEAAQSSIEVSRARVAVAQSTLRRTIIRAPFTGVVAELNAELGEFITPSPTGIATLPPIDLLDLSCRYVSAPIDEVDTAAIRTDMQAFVSLDAFPKQRWRGSVRRIAPYVLEREKQARTVEVEVEITDPLALQDLLPGYSADIEVVIEARDQVLRVPSEAVLEGNRVLVFDETAGRLEERVFDAGLSNWEYTEVRAGLAEGDRIVVSLGQEGVKAGAYALAATENRARRQTLAPL
jgi:HlyD family secretion protein